MIMIKVNGYVMMYHLLFLKREKAPNKYFKTETNCI